MAIIESIKYRKVVNSHVQLTNEFIITLNDGTTGFASSPQGETISIYEDRKVTIDPQMIIDTLQHDGLIGKVIIQNDFDDYLHQRISFFGRNNAYGLSEAFFNATNASHSVFELFGKQKTKLEAPYLCLNILNGGWHAYTNPVLSDFSEFMLVAKSTDIAEVIGEHNEIQRVVKEKQLSQEKTVVSGNPVNSFPIRDNREVIEFLLKIVDDLGFTKKYDLMIDASAGDLWNGDGYTLGVTNNKKYTRDEFIEYWQEMINKYNLAFLEDPFYEKDFNSWTLLTTSQENSCIIGDNLYSSDANRIANGAAKKYARAAVIKPNQAGTVSAVIRAIEAAQNTNQSVITSHRSISTESTFISKLTCVFNVRYIKIGPLVTDYSSIVRLNEIIRLTEA
jgi:enolase